MPLNSTSAAPRAAVLLLASALGACAVAVDPRVAPPDDVQFIPLPDGGVSCRANNDGVLTRDEVVFAPGIEIRYRMNPRGTSATVNPRGQAQPDGTRVWDFSSDAGDLVPLSLSLSSGQWYSPTFTDAQYAARIDPREPVVGLYRATSSSLDFLGLAGEQESSGTRVRYSAAIPILRFPVMQGNAWMVDVQTTDGMVNNTPVASRDHYDITVDARGEVRLGVLTFRNALRVRLETTQRFPAGPGVHRIQYLWLVECYGEVARMTSMDNEVDPDFTQAVEYRHLGL